MSPLEKRLLKKKKKEKRLLRPLDNFLIGLFVFCVHDWVVAVFNIVWIWNPYQLYDLKKKNHSMDCLCIRLITTFDSQKSLILMKLSWPLLSFVACAFQYQIQEITAKCNVPTFPPTFSSTVVISCLCCFYILQSSLSTLQ